MEAVVAMDDPEIAAKKAQAAMATIETPPAIQPTSASAKSMRRFERPPLLITSPASMKAGTASSENESAPANMRWPMMTKLRSGLTAMEATQESASDQMIGTPRTRATSSTPNRVIVAISMSFPLVAAFHGGLDVIGRGNRHAAVLGIHESLGLLDELEHECDER